MYRQFELESENKKHVCWIEDDPKLKVGALFSFKNDPVVWKITRKYGIALEKPPRTDWNNNI